MYNRQSTPDSGICGIEAQLDRIGCTVVSITVHSGQSRRKLMSTEILRDIKESVYSNGKRCYYFLRLMVEKWQS